MFLSLFMTSLRCFNDLRLRYIVSVHYKRQKYMQLSVLKSILAGFLALIL